MAEIENIHCPICTQPILSSWQNALPPALATDERRGVTSNQNTEKMMMGGETFYANADISPFCLASVMVQNYLLLLSDADSQNWKNCKTNESKF